PAHAAAAGLAPHAHQGPQLPRARPLRQRRPEPFARAGQRPRSRAKSPGQEVRFPPLRRRRPRLLVLPRPGLSPAAGYGRLEQDLGLLRRQPEVVTRFIARKGGCVLSAQPPSLCRWLKRFSPPLSLRAKASAEAKQPRALHPLALPVVLKVLAAAVIASE